MHAEVARPRPTKGVHCSFNGCKETGAGWQERERGGALSGALGPCLRVVLSARPS